MGKIQSAITGLIATSIGAVAASKGVAATKAIKAAASQEQTENAAIEQEAKGMFGKAFEGANQEERNNLVERQEDAMKITDQFVKSAKFQKEAFKKRLEKVNGPEAIAVRAAAKDAKEKLKLVHQAKIDALKKKKEGKVNEQK